MKFKYDFRINWEMQFIGEPKTSRFVEKLWLAFSALNERARIASRSVVLVLQQMLETDA